jgi:hypothetical protein
MPILKAGRVIELKKGLKQCQAMDRQDFVQMAMEICQIGQARVDRWLRALGYGRLAATLREEVSASDTRDRSWFNWMVRKLQLALQVTRQLEAQRERWGTRGTVREWFADKERSVSGVRDELLDNGDECGVGLREAGKVVCLKDMKLFRIRIGKLPHVTVFPAFNRIGHGPPLFVVLPRFASAQGRFAVFHSRRLYIVHPASGWVPGPVFCEFAEWICEWLDGYRAERGWRAERAVLVLGQAPTRGTRTLFEYLQNTM